MTDTPSERRGGLATLLMALAALAAGTAIAAPETTTACASLCGSWQLDTAASDALEPALDSVFAHFKDPRPERVQKGRVDNVQSLARAEDEASLGPIMQRPPRERLREELVQTLRAPPTLVLGAKGPDVLIGGGDGQSPRRLTPGEPHARIDAQGTARIRCEWRQGRFVISESYDRRNEYSESYALQRDAGTLLVTRIVKRPGLPELRLKTVYRRV